MTRLLKTLRVLATGLGFLLALPGFALLMAATGLSNLLLARERAAQQRALDSEIE